MYEDVAMTVAEDACERQGVSKEGEPIRRVRLKISLVCICNSVMLCNVIYNEMYAWAVSCFHSV